MLLSQEPGATTLFLWQSVNSEIFSGKLSWYLPFFKGSNDGIAENISRRSARSPGRKPWVWSVACSPPATSASVAHLMLSISRNVNARTVRWPLLTAAGYKLVLLSRKVLCPVLSIRVSLCFHPGCTCTRTFPTHSWNKAIGIEKWNERAWLWPCGTLLIFMSIFVCGSHIQQNSWKHALNVDFFSGSCQED